MKTKLPIGIQDFVTIREGGLLYVDKTPLIHRLLTGSGQTFFLPRPRRFGKSLLCSTIAAVFEGRRELFGAIAGQPALAIDSLEWDWKPRPVIRLDLNAGNYAEGAEVLEENLRDIMADKADTEGIELKETYEAIQFKNLIRDLYRKHNNERVVVVIDEYDKPLLSTMDNESLHKKMLEKLKGFYGALKSSDQYLRFVFLTGVTKFSQIGVFSDLNQPVDLTLDARYAALCGITQEELERTSPRRSTECSG